MRPPFSSVQSLSRVRLFATPWIAARQASLSITNSWSLLKLMSIKSVMPSSHLILCHPLLLLPPIPPSIRVFSMSWSLCMNWPKYWTLSFSISPSNEHPGLIPFRNDWLDLLAVQGTLKSLLQHHSSKASIFWHSAFFTVQLSHPYMTIRYKTWEAMSFTLNKLVYFLSQSVKIKSGKETKYQVTRHHHLLPVSKPTRIPAEAVLFPLYYSKVTFPW